MGIHKLKDTLKPQGDFDHNSETNKSYKDNHASRPVIHKLKDHSVDVQPEGSLAKKIQHQLCQEHERGACSTGLAFRFREGHHRVNEYHIIVVLILVRRRHITLSSPKKRQPNQIITLLH